MTENPRVPTTGEAAQPPKRHVPKFIRLLAGAVRLVLFVILTGWASLAIYYSNLPASLRPIASGIFIAAAVYLLLVVKSRTRRLVGLFALFGGVIVWWLAIPPSNDRQWQADVAVLPWAEIAGNRVTVHNIRWCDYRSEDDYTVRHYDRAFDLDKLHAADLFLVHWGSPHIAHTMLSFGFDDDQYLCFSIETRKEKGEGFSTVKGFFKQYELVYVAADERDLVRLRTDFRHEQVYLYRLKTDPEQLRGVFLGYVKAINSLHDRPEWYNALTGNCTTTIRGHTLPYAGDKRFNWRFLLNGHLDELMYERGVLDRSLPLAELNARSLINARAAGIGDSPDYSRRIREGLPGVHPQP